MAAGDVPFYSDGKRAYGAIKRVLALPCEVPALVYMEAAVQGAWKAASSILEPDAKEFYHQQIGNSLYHSIKEGLVEAEIVAPPETSLITRTLFKLADTYDVTLWYLFLFSAVTEGLIDFSSQVMKMQPCKSGGDPNYFSGGPYINAIGDDGAYWPDLFSGKDGAGTSLVQTANAILPERTSGFVTASCAFTDFGGAKVPSETAIIESVTGTILDIASVDPNVEGGVVQAHAFYKTRNDKGETYTFEAKSAYTGGAPLPLHEAFRDGDKWFGSCYSPGSGRHT